VGVQNKVGAALTGDSISAIYLLPDLLQEMPLLRFSGDQDLIANHLGAEPILEKLAQNGNGTVEITHEKPFLIADWSCQGQPSRGFKMLQT
jgi:carboxypeptidase D